LKALEEYLPALLNRNIAVFTAHPVHSTSGACSALRQATVKQTQTHDVTIHSMALIQRRPQFRPTCNKNHIQRKLLTIYLRS